MALQAYAKRLIVERTKAPDKKGEIILPDEAKKRPNSGKVVSVGDKIEGKVKVGDTVHSAQYAGMDLENNGKTVVILSEEDVLATESA